MNKCRRHNNKYYIDRKLRNNVAIETQFKTSKGWKFLLKVIG